MFLLPEAPEASEVLAAATAAQTEMVIQISPEVLQLQNASDAVLHGDKDANIANTNTPTTTAIVIILSGQFTITLEANGGTINPDTHPVTYDAPIGQLPAPIRSGYTFTAEPDKTTINISTLPKGLYILRTNSKTIKIVKI